MGKKNSTLRPEVLEDLRNCTEYSDSEIMTWCKGFFKDCPTGRLTLREFKDIYHKVFPNGNASKFAEHVFRTFDTNKDNTIDFREFLCGLHVTTRGTPEEKLQWAFRMYDMDGDGFIQYHEMVDMLTAIFKMVRPVIKRSPTDDLEIGKLADKIFRQGDTNRDGKLSWEEFNRFAKDNPMIVSVLLGDSKFSLE
ncbi:hypothetical protein HPB47_022239 [Ixodes persulcatus]|uniref:Uncharacterized protein n=1 Tax=Ixodes persulcatus TaxID=34615 RepID=A0AC60QB99_IXOPE|nr:hypothetical protein HPB47_022239 [Ixodes persulcatus]